MRIAVIALTRSGSRLALSIGVNLKAHVYIKDSFFEPKLMDEEVVFPIMGSLAELVRVIFSKYDSLVFIMACGIVVRALAPLIRTKTTDPAVLVMDEKGRHVISLLSGHIGGANRLAEAIAAITGGTAVITTATDINEAIAFDIFAVENDCAIENIDALKYISAELVNGGKVGFFTDCTIQGDLPGNIVHFPESGLEAPGNLQYRVALTNKTGLKIQGERVLVLRPRNLVLGIGCKRGTPKEHIELAVMDFTERNSYSALSLKCMTTIDLKADEVGLAEFCKEQGIPLRIIPRKEIEAVESRFISSDFVKDKVGVASVAEPCAVLAAAGGRLISGKTVYKGITLALAEEEKVFKL